MAGKRLLQEAFGGDPYKVLVSSMLLVRTQGRQVAKICPRLFRKYPTARRLAKADESDLRRILRPLGLYNIRARQLIRFAREVAARGFPKTREEADRLPYVGGYVADAYAILVLRDYSVKPTDRELRAYLKGVRRLKK